MDPPLSARRLLALSAVAQRSPAPFPAFTTLLTRWPLRGEPWPRPRRRSSISGQESLWIARRWEPLHVMTYVGMGMLGAFGSLFSWVALDSPKVLPAGFRTALLACSLWSLGTAGAFAWLRWKSRATPIHLEISEDGLMFDWADGREETLPWHRFGRMFLLRDYSNNPRVGENSPLGRWQMGGGIDRRTPFPRGRSGGFWRLQGPTDSESTLNRSHNRSSEPMRAGNSDSDAPHSPMSQGSARAQRGPFRSRALFPAFTTLLTRRPISGVPLYS